MHWLTGGDWGEDDEAGVDESATRLMDGQGRRKRAGGSQRQFTGGKNPVVEVAMKAKRLREATEATQAPAAVQDPVPRLGPSNPKVLDDEFGSSGEEDEATDYALVVSNLHGNVYSAAFLFSVRGLAEDRKCSVVASWLWVALGHMVNLFCLYMVYRRVSNLTVERSDNEFGSLKRIMGRLHEAYESNLTLSGTDDLDREVVNTCRFCPSGMVFDGLEFLLSIFFMAAMSDARALLVQIVCCPRLFVREQSTSEQEQHTTINGLPLGDGLVYIAGLVLPKLAFYASLWYLGSKMLAMTRKLIEIVQTVIMLICISQVDWIVFTAILSSSKRRWVEKTRVVQQQTHLWRYASAWPGEVLKLGLLIAATLGARWLFSEQFELRILCWQCSSDCARRCSRAFDRCSPDDDPGIQLNIGFPS